VHKIRVLVANRPRLMRELVLATILDQPDITVMGEIRDDTEIAQIVAESNPDVVIIALGSPENRPVLCDALLSRHPQLKILALAPESNNSVLYWSSMQIHSAQVESSEEGILGALRSQAHLLDQISEPIQISGTRRPS